MLEMYNETEILKMLICIKIKKDFIFMNLFAFKIYTCDISFGYILDCIYFAGIFFFSNTEL